MTKKSMGDHVIMLEVVVRQRELWTSSDVGDEHGVVRPRQASLTTDSPQKGNIGVQPGGKCSRSVAHFRMSSSSLAPYYDVTHYEPARSGFRAPRNRTLLAVGEPILPYPLMVRLRMMRREHME